MRHNLDGCCLQELRWFGIVAWACLALSCDGPQRASSSARDIPHVQSLVVSTHDVPNRYFVGSIVAAARRRLGFEVSGVVRRVAVAEGAQIAAGQVIAELTQSNLAPRQRALRAELEQARRDAETAERLLTHGAGTLATKENAETRLQLAAASLSLADTEAARDILIAPVAGRVVQLLVHAREVVAAGSAVIVVEDAERHARLSVSEAEAAELRQGEPIELLIAGRTVAAHVLSVGVTPDADGTYVVDVLPERQSEVSERTGTTVRARQPRLQARAVSIPLDSVVRRQGEPSVLLVRGEGRAATVEARRVELGSSTGAEVLVRQGLSGGERIVADGAYFLADGEQVDAR